MEANSPPLWEPEWPKFILGLSEQLWSNYDTQDTGSGNGHQTLTHEKSAGWGAIAPEGPLVCFDGSFLLWPSHV